MGVTFSNLKNDARLIERYVANRIGKFGVVFINCNFVADLMPRQQMFRLQLQRGSEDPCQLLCGRSHHVVHGEDIDKGFVKANQHLC